MKKSLLIFIQIVIGIIGIGTLVFMLWEPHLEGRNAHATPFEIYFKDPFLAYAYIASIPFFVALYQTFMLLSDIGKNKEFSELSVKSVRKIKYCVMAVIGFIIGGMIFIFFGGDEDRAGALALGICATFIFILIASAAAVFERILQKAVDIKSENDLTV